MDVTHRSGERPPIVGDRCRRRDRILRPVPYELPSYGRASRRAVIGRWLTFALVALLVAAVAYLGYVGFAGSEQVVEPARSRDCRTPAIAFGWEYEPINYPAAADRAKAHCAGGGSAKCCAHGAEKASCAPGSKASSSTGDAKSESAAPASSATADRRSGRARATTAK